MGRLRATLRARAPFRGRLASFTGGWEIAHRYGPQVHILNNRFLHSVLARLGGTQVRHPEINELLRVVYRAMTVTVAGRELPTVEGAVPTRMIETTEAGVYRGEILDRDTRVVVVSVIRAGIIPSQVGFDMLNMVLDPGHVRLDHFHMARRTNRRGRVRGVSLEGSKIGGSVEGSILLLPDPMGATGTTTREVVRHYRRTHGTPAKIVCMPMIATPEYLRRVLGEVPGAVVYTARLDRGLSPRDVLRAVPGERWAEERGLDEHDYIVPGAGGMGEVLNNSWC
ncbi:MAG TPA: uracil phosphoribosyltransferase [Planctomycetota bacterium]|jgi:uracil phosphoribosyltransferase|nr:uracil phosphoribosyltransferase [Planctomycetota bacterium]